MAADDTRCKQSITVAFDNHPYSPSPIDQTLLTNVRFIMGSRHPHEAAQRAAIVTSTVLLEDMRAGGNITADDVLFALDAPRGLARARSLELNETLAASLGRRWES